MESIPIAPHPDEVNRRFMDLTSVRFIRRAGYVLGHSSCKQRDSFSVHHVPEEWIDGIFTEDRGSRGGRPLMDPFHPNACGSSEADADADSGEGCDMILGVRFSRGTRPG